MMVIWIHLFGPLLKNPKGEAPHRADAHVLLFRLKPAAEGSRLFRRVLMQLIVRHLDSVESARLYEIVTPRVIVLSCEYVELHTTVVAQILQFSKQSACS